MRTSRPASSVTASGNAGLSAAGVAIQEAGVAGAGVCAATRGDETEKNRRAIIATRRTRTDHLHGRTSAVPEVTSRAGRKQHPRAVSARGIRGATDRHADFPCSREPPASRQRWAFWLPNHAWSGHSCGTAPVLHRTSPVSASSLQTRPSAAHSIVTGTLPRGDPTSKPRVRRRCEQESCAAGAGGTPRRGYRG
jgi:hypothetical protein